MYYVKTKINEETTLTTELTDENVFTQCPECGKEFAIDLTDVFLNGGDLYSTVIYCVECSAKRIKTKK
ncbi:MAG: hypothetical protein K2I82_03175 [Ruminococcus sp.]|nr:hypothetical protein [Ruminococcus sp.]